MYKTQGMKVILTEAENTLILSGKKVYVFGLPVIVISNGRIPY